MALSPSYLPRRGIAICAGGLGLELGIRIASPEYTSVCFIEWESYAASLIVARMEMEAVDQAPIWDDVTTFDGIPWRGKVDCISAGFPCQPFSVAGQQRGVTDSRNIWPDVARVIRDVSPQIVFLENVPAVLPYYYYEIKPTLQTLGYSVAEGIFSASEVGASHERQRLFILANASELQWESTSPTQPSTSGGLTAVCAGRNSRSDTLADARHNARRSEQQQQSQEWGEVTRAGSPSDFREVGNAHLSDAQGRQRVWSRTDTKATSYQIPAFPPGPADDLWSEIIEARPDLAPAIPKGVKPELHRMVDGVADWMVRRSVRKSRISVLGNGVVPLVSAYAFLTLQARLNL